MVQILPNGTVWIPSLVKTITDVVSNGSKPIVVDQKLIEGPNPNARGKFLIPLILAFQVNWQDSLVFDENDFGAFTSFFISVSCVISNIV